MRGGRNSASNGERGVCLRGSTTVVTMPVLRKRVGLEELERRESERSYQQQPGSSCSVQCNEMTGSLLRPTFLVGLFLTFLAIALQGEYAFALSFYGKDINFLLFIFLSSFSNISFRPLLLSNSNVDLSRPFSLPRCLMFFLIIVYLPSVSFFFPFRFLFPPYFPTRSHLSRIRSRILRTFARWCQAGKTLRDIASHVNLFLSL